MAGIKRGKWIQAKRFRVTKKNGRTVIEVQRTVKRKTRTNPSRRKSKKAVKRGATSGSKSARKKQYAALRKEFGWR